MHESNKLIKTAIDRGATVAKRLCGKDDFYLSENARI
jgi:hypothetical protein